MEEGMVRTKHNQEKWIMKDYQFYEKCQNQINFNCKLVINFNFLNFFEKTAFLYERLIR